MADVSGTATNGVANEKGIVGIQNMGNTCYANSTIQILRACPEWSAFVLTSEFGKAGTPVPKPTSILLAYQDIIKSLWSAARPAYVRPLGFFSVIQEAVRGSVYESFGRREPNDCHEYLVYLLDNFHEALRTDSSKDPFTADLKPNSPVVDLFFGLIRKTVCCEACGTKSTRFEPFNVFKIPCDGGATFLDWATAELADSAVDDYDCVACRPTRRRATIESRLWRLPQALFVSLRRFQPNGMKIMSPVPYDGAPVTFTELFAADSPDPSRDWKYEVRAVADHHGNHMGGHYSAQFCHPATRQFWLIDDERSTPLPAGPVFGRSTYVVFFRRID